MNLEAKHNQAICEEIGKRLRTDLSREQASTPHQLRQLLHRLEEADSRLAARFSPSGAANMPPYIRHDFEAVTRLGGRDPATDGDGYTNRGSRGWNRPVGPLDASAEADVQPPMAGSRLQTSTSREGELAPANETFQVKGAKPAAKVRILPPDEIFLGLAVASIVLLLEIAILVLLAS
jgi:hypothetical protein